jgi:putative acetyltransferase
MTEETVSIRPADPFAPESLRLIEQLWSELGALYPEVSGPPFPPKDIVGDRAVFVLAWSDGQAIACGALRPFPSGDFSIGEIKRMFVAPHARGQGWLERFLRSWRNWLGVAVVGARDWKPAYDSRARSICETSGCQRIEPYGRYANDPLSLCFEKSREVKALS